MTIVTEVIGPVVRMCGNPQCGGWWDSCDRIRRDAPMGTTTEIDLAKALADDIVCRIIRDDLSLDYASDSAGIRRAVPDGCEFTVHKSTALEGKLRYTAIYSGPAHDADEVLAGSPEWDWDAVHERFKRMRAGDVIST